MVSRSRRIAWLALSGVLSAVGCGGTSADSLFTRQTEAPSPRGGEADAAPSSGSGGLEGAGGEHLEGPRGAGGASGQPSGAAGSSAGGASVGSGGSSGAAPSAPTFADAGPPCEASRFYVDQDRDGFGDPKRVTLACEKPDGHVTNSDDCYDGNANAHPGQTMLFDVDRGDGSYDYDCDGVGAPSTTMVGHCGTFPFCTGSAGWKGSAPTCGVSATWLDACTGLTTICGQKAETRVQQCL